MELNFDKNKMQKIKLIIALSIVGILAIIGIVRFIIYQKVGEKNMPYSISKIIVVSRANKLDEPTENKEEEQSEEATEENTEENAEETEESEENSEETAEEVGDNPVWNFDVIQTNDIYISIEKNEENIKKNEKLKSVSISNIQVIENPIKGTLKAFMPNSLDGDRYKYSDDYKIGESLTYRAAENSNLQNLQVSMNGGIIGFSITNAELGKYVSTAEDEEITYDGSLLSKIGITSEDVRSKISFDITIELDNGKKYCGNVVMDITCEGLVENGTTKQEITDFSNVKYKRI